MGDLSIKSNWSHDVRRAAARFRTALRASDRTLQLRLELGKDEEEALLQKAAEEALALIELLQDLGYGSREREGHGVDAIDLELKVHDSYQDASRNLFRCIIAARKGSALGEALTRKGRLDSGEEAEELRTGHVGAIRAALEEAGRREGYLSPDHIPWVRRERDEGEIPTVRRPRLPGESHLEPVETQLVHLVDEEEG